MAKVIARICLVPGHVAYYDERSNTYLTWGNPTKNILEGTDVRDLRKSVAAGTIKVIEGSLGHLKTFKQILMEAKSKRTGEPLEKLMGNSKIVDKNGNYADEVAAPIIEKDIEKSATEIDAGKATAVPEASIQAQAVAVETADSSSNDTEKTKTAAKKTTKKAKKVVVDDEPEMVVNEEEMVIEESESDESEETASEKKAAKRTSKKK